MLETNLVARYVVLPVEINIQLLIVINGIGMIFSFFSVVDHETRCG